MRFLDEMWHPNVYPVRFHLSRWVLTVDCRTAAFASQSFTLLVRTSRVVSCQRSDGTQPNKSGEELLTPPVNQSIKTLLFIVWH